MAILTLKTFSTAGSWGVTSWSGSNGVDSSEGITGSGVGGTLSQMAAAGTGGNIHVIFPDGVTDAWFFHPGSGTASDQTLTDTIDTLGQQGDFTIRWDWGHGSSQSWVQLEDDTGAVLAYSDSGMIGNTIAPEDTGEFVVTIGSADTTAPVIVLNGNANITINQYEGPYAPTATASDDTDGDITHLMVQSGDAVDPNTAGAYVVRFNVSDAAGNVAVEVLQVVTVLAVDDWTFGGQLHSILKFAVGKDSVGVRSCAFLKKENDTVTLVMTADKGSFGAYVEYNAAASGMTGVPHDMAFGKDGELAISTSTGLYIVDVGAASVPQSYTSAIVAQGHPIKTLKYGQTSDEWAFSAVVGSTCGVYSFAWPANGVGAAIPASPRINLDASAGLGAHAIDIAEGNDGWMITSYLANVGTRLVYASNDWSVVKEEDEIKTLLKDPDVYDVKYDYALDRWTAGKPDAIGSGVTVITTNDITEWLD